MIRSVYLSPDGKIQTDVAQGEFILHLHEEGGLLWIDMFGQDKDNYKLVFERIMSFHPLAVVAALEQTHSPKIDDWGKYLYIVLHDFGFDPQNPARLLLRELDIFVGKGFLVTYHTEPFETLEKVWDLCQWDPRYLKRGAFNLLYHLADEMVSAHLPVFDAIENTIDEIEGQIMRTERPDTLENIFSIKRGLLRMRRVLTPQREVFYKMSHNDYMLIDDIDRHYFRNIYNHYVRLDDLAENLRELVASALQVHLSATNIRLSQVVKILTIITTMFMPLSVIVGFFGMNFFQSEFSLFNPLGRVVLAVAVTILVSAPVIMYYFMRHREWM